MSKTYLDNPTAIRIEVRKEGNFFIADLIASNGPWVDWLKFRTLKELTKEARARGIDCPIVRV